MTTSGAVIKKPLVGDVPGIQKLINGFAEENLMLPRSKTEIYENIRDFWVAKEGDAVVACCAIHVTWEDLGEIKSLAVRREHWRHGIGKQLVERCIDEAKTLGLNKVFALTYVPGFFINLGFAESSKDKLPHKVWSECIKCFKFPDCDENCVVRDI